MPNPTEAEITAMRYPGSGAVTDPAQVRNPPAVVGAPADDRLANGEASGVPAVADEWGADLNGHRETDFDFAVEGDPRSLDGHEVSAAEAVQAELQEGQPPGENPVDAALRVMFRGQERTYTPDAARTMLQQFLALQEQHQQHAPLLDGSRALMAQLGMNDPGQFMQAVYAGLQALQERGAQMQQGQQATQQMGQSAPQPDVDVDQVLVQMEEENGIRLPDAMRSSLSVLLKHANDVAQVSRTLPQIMQDVEAFKQHHQMQQQAAIETAVNTVAANVATELGLKDEDHFEQFVGWLDEMDGMAPGFKQAAGTDPAKMERALRTFAKVALGGQAMQQVEQHRATAVKNAQRAGGDMGVVAARGVTGPMTAQRRDFNRQMLDEL